MEENELYYAKGVLLRLSQAALSDRALAARVREMVLQSGLLHVFGEGPTVDVAAVLDAGGEGLLRTRLQQLDLADLRKLLEVHAFDPERASARWRSPVRFIDLIIARATAEQEGRRRALLEQQYAIAAAAATIQPAPETPPAEAPKDASWML